MGNKDFDNFDEFSDNYREIHNKNIRISGADSNFFSEFKIKILSKWEKQDKYRILDFGCGDGNSEVFFNRYYPQSVISGVDVSAESIEKARSRNLNNCQFTHYSGYQLPYEDNHFDFAFVSTVLHHIDEELQPKLLEDILRALKPGGRLYVFEHNPNNFLTRRVVQKCEFDKDAILIPYKTMKSRVHSAGFMNIKCKFIFFVPRLPVLCLLAFIESMLTWLPLGGQYYIRAIK